MRGIRGRWRGCCRGVRGAWRWGREGRRWRGWGWRLGGGRVAAEPEAVAQIVALTGRLPLALSIVAARAAGHPGYRLAALAGGVGGGGGGGGARGGGGG